MNTGTEISNTPQILRLPGHEGAAPRARRALAAMLTEWHMTELMDNAGIVTAELVTNAAKLGKEFSLTFRRLAAGTLRIEVADHSASAPVLADPLADLTNGDFDDNGGRGLVLVDALSDRWGFDPTATGKIVWAVLSCR